MAIQKSRHRIDVDSDIGIGISIKMSKLSGAHFKSLLESKITSIVLYILNTNLVNSASS